VASNDLLSTEFGRELVLLNLNDGVYYGLDDVGLEIWKLLQQPTTFTGIRDAILGAYDVEPARCERDLALLLEDLARRGLIEIRT
jgi:Coenzyme PQQ synthesis protein D (PqqD)